MQQPAKSQIITLRDWADVATALIRRFMQLRLEDATDDPATIQALIDQWTIEDSVRWVGTLLDDEFNNQMRWSASSDLAFTGLLLEMKTKYAQYLPDVLDEERSNKRQRREFLEDLICELDPITIVVGSSSPRWSHRTPGGCGRCTCAVTWCWWNPTRTTASRSSTRRWKRANGP